MDEIESKRFRNMLVIITIILIVIISLGMVYQTYVRASETSIGGWETSNDTLNYVFFIGDITIDSEKGNFTCFKIGEYYILSFSSTNLYIRIVGYMVKPKVGLVGVDNLVWDNIYSKITGFILFEGLLIEDDDGFRLDGSFLYNRISVM